MSLYAGTVYFGGDTGSSIAFNAPNFTDGVFSGDGPQTVSEITNGAQTLPDGQKDAVATFTAAYGNSVAYTSYNPSTDAGGLYLVNLTSETTTTVVDSFATYTLRSPSTARPPVTVPMPSTSWPIGCWLFPVPS